MPSYSTLTVERNVAVPMRDGVNLFTDVYRPAGPGPFPTIMQRTPYDKSTGNLGQLMLRAVELGYAVVIQDVRGRFASEGEFMAFVNERNDGYDMLEWLTNQPWCDGNVGMFSQSYVGFDAVAGSAQRASVPKSNRPGRYSRQLSRRLGVPRRCL